MRYSFDEGLVDLARGVVVPFDELLDEILGLIAEDAEALGCMKEVAGVRDILSRGTSAHRQLRDFELEQAAGKSVEDSLKAVVDTLISDTADGL
jgi:carboxylate-amine ligase